MAVNIMEEENFGGFWIGTFFGDFMPPPIIPQYGPLENPPYIPFVCDEYWGEEAINVV